MVFFSVDDQALHGTAGPCQASRIFLALPIIYKLFELGGRMQRTWVGMPRDMGQEAWCRGAGFDLP